MLNRFSCLVLITLSTASTLANSIHQTGERPQIGVAHIGVLGELERLQIPIDYIAGSSVGSIIGGLYASGYSLDEIEGIIADIDWDDVLIDAPLGASKPLYASVKMSISG
jgi:NTE family protein